jgi:hypothetical protein
MPPTGDQAVVIANRPRQGQYANFVAALTTQNSHRTEGIHADARGSSNDPSISLCKDVFLAEKEKM